MLFPAFSFGQEHREACHHDDSSEGEGTCCYPTTSRHDDGCAVAAPDSSRTAPSPPDSLCNDSSVSRSVLIIFYQDGTAKKRLRKALRKLHCETLYEYRSFNGMAVKIPSGADINDIIRRLRNVRGVLSVARDRMLQLDTELSVERGRMLQLDTCS